MDKDDIRPIQLILEIEQRKRLRRSTILVTIGSGLAIVGLALMWTEAFGTALVLTVLGVMLATVGQEMMK